MIDYIYIGVIVTSPIWIMSLLCLWEYFTYKRPQKNVNSGAKFG